MGNVGKEDFVRLIALSRNQPGGNQENQEILIEVNPKLGSSMQEMHVMNVAA